MLFFRSNQVTLERSIEQHRRSNKKKKYREDCEVETRKRKENSDKRNIKMEKTSGRKMSRRRITNLIFVSVNSVEIVADKLCLLFFEFFFSSPYFYSSRLSVRIIKRTNLSFHWAFVSADVQCVTSIKIPRCVSFFKKYCTRVKETLQRDGYFSRSYSLLIFSSPTRKQTVFLESTVHCACTDETSVYIYFTGASRQVTVV